MPLFVAPWRRQRPPAGDPAFADTLTIPVLLPGPLDRPAVLLRPRRSPRPVTPPPEVRRRRGPAAAWAMVLGVAGLVAALGVAGVVVVRAGLAPAGDTWPSLPGAAAASPPPAAMAPPRQGATGLPGVASGAGVPPARAVSSQAGPVPAPALRAAAAPQRRAAALRQQIAVLQHEWEVAEAMRLRYRDLHAQGLVSWEAWRAQENEALRLRLHLQELQRRGSAGVVRPQSGPG